jgi:hypothetical protein
VRERNRAFERVDCKFARLLPRKLRFQLGAALLGDQFGLHHSSL